MNILNLFTVAEIKTEYDTSCVWGTTADCVQDSLLSVSELDSSTMKITFTLDLVYGVYTIATILCHGCNYWQFM